MTQFSGGISSEVLAEAVVIAGYALDEPVAASDIERFREAVGDPFLAMTFLSVADHVCGLRRMRRLAHESLPFE